MSKITIISGSPAEHTRLNGILDYVTNYLHEANIDLEVINIRKLPAEDLLHAKFESKEILDANNKVADSSGIIILTPVYKAAYSGILKTYLDLLPQNGLKDKTILPIVIGGTFSHLLVIDYAIKPLLAGLGATKILKGDFILDSQVTRLANNQYEVIQDAQNRLNRSLSTLMKLEEQHYAPNI